MKKPRLLIALLVMLVAASGYAQDSYQQTVKDYLTAINQFETGKPLISTLSKMFERDGAVDIDELTKRYLDERYEEDMICFFVAAWLEQGMTEDDLRELSSLVTTPEFKVYSDHTKSWMIDYASYMMAPLVESMTNLKEAIESGEYKYKPSEYASRIESPVVQRPEINAAYAEKFNSVMLKSPYAKQMMDSMLKRFDEKKNSDDPVLQESNEKVKDWMIKNVPVLLLNFAYDNLTIEDIDYAAKLFANETYRKFQNFDTNNVDMESLTNKFVFARYMEWMEEHGAKKNYTDPQAFLEFLKSVFGPVSE